jgi:type VI secretion system protein VasG
MAEISRVALFGKLNSLCYRAIESSTVFCKLRGNPYVEMVHWVHQILQLQDSDLHRIIRHYELDAAVLARDLTAALDRLPRGATSVTDLSSQLEETVERAWVYGTLMFGESQVRSGHLVFGMLKTTNLRNALYAISRQFERVKADDLSDRFAHLLKESPEAQLAPATASRPRRGEAIGAIAPARWASRKR